MERQGGKITSHSIEHILSGDIARDMKRCQKNDDEMEAKPFTNKDANRSLRNENKSPLQNLGM